VDSKLPLTDGCRPAGGGLRLSRRSSVPLALCDVRQGCPLLKRGLVERRPPGLWIRGARRSAGSLNSARRFSDLGLLVIGVEEVRSPLSAAGAGTCLRTKTGTTASRADRGSAHHLFRWSAPRPLTRRRSQSVCSLRPWCARSTPRRRPPGSIPRRCWRPVWPSWSCDSCAPCELPD